MVIDLVVGLIGKVLGLGSGILEKSQHLKEVRLEGEIRIAVAQAEAEIARQSKLIDAEVSWDQEAAKQMQSSWKDEYLTILLSMPMILAFVGPWGRDAVANGFGAVSTAPEWYRVSFLTVIAASFGVRTLVNRFGFGKKS